MYIASCHNQNNDNNNRETILMIEKAWHFNEYLTVIPSY